MSRAVIPVANIARRATEHGRIRLGMKGERGPKSLETLRFTSQDEEVIRQLAEQYGGTAKSWKPKPNRTEYEVITNAKEIPVRLPPDPLGGTPIYEAWTAGGIQRRCDGVTVEVPTRTPDGVEMAEENCLCAVQDRFFCKPITRLSVIIPTVKFGGVWRLESKAWGAAHEMPGMVDLIQALQSQGLAKAVLTIEKRSDTKEGKTHHWIVPVLRLDDTIQNLEDVQPALAAAPQAELPAQVEIVDEDEAYKALAPARFELLRAAARIHVSATDVAGFVFTVTEGETESLADCDAGQLARILDVFRKIQNQELVFHGLDHKRAIVKKPA